MLVGYMRVSSDSDRQSTDLQRDALLAAADDLDLPPFTVPAPRRSAERETMLRIRAAQAAAVRPQPRPVAPRAVPATAQQPVAESLVARPQPTTAPPATTKRPTVIPDRPTDDTPTHDPGRGRLQALIWLTVVLLVAALLAERPGTPIPPGRPRPCPRG